MILQAIGAPNRKMTAAQWRQVYKRERDLATQLTSNRYRVVVAPADLIGRLVRNPDELFDKDPQGYDKVLTNPIVTSEFQTLCSPIVDADVTVEGFPDDYNERLTQIINEIPNRCEGMEQALYAYFTGLRIIELVWGTRNIGGVTYNVPVDFIPHDHQRFAYDEDWRLWMTQDGSGGYYPNRNNIVQMEGGTAEYVNPRKVLIHRYRNGDGRYNYGHGEGRAVYRWVEFMNAVLEFWADYVQSYARPIKLLKISPEVLQAAIVNSNEATDDDGDSDSVESYMQGELTKLENMIENDAFTTDARNEFELVSPGTAPTEIFGDLLTVLEKFIKYHISGETMTSSEGNEGNGSYALAKVHRGTQAGRRGRLCRGLEHTMTQQLLKYIIHFNRARFEGLSVQHQGKVRILAPMLTPEEQLSLGIQTKARVLKKEVHKLIDFTVPSKEQIENDETMVLGVGDGLGGEEGPDGSASPFNDEFGGSPFDRVHATFGKKKPEPQAQ